MAELKREIVKYVRDFLKKDYAPKEKCYICNSIEELETHHLYSLSEIWNKWIEENKYIVETKEDVFKYRVLFEQRFEWEMGLENLFTLCHKHHEKLHNIYGQRYELRMIPKIRNWIEIQRGKFN